MNIFKSLAIVLKSENWRETSKILTLFSQRFGKIRVIAKGARDPKSRLAGNLELFSQISIVFYKKENTSSKCIPLRSGTLMYSPWWVVFGR